MGIIFVKGKDIENAIYSRFSLFIFVYKTINVKINNGCNRFLLLLPQLLEHICESNLSNFFQLNAISSVKYCDMSVSRPFKISVIEKDCSKNWICCFFIQLK